MQQAVYWFSVHCKASKKCCRSCSQSHCHLLQRHGQHAQQRLRLKDSADALIIGSSSSISNSMSNNLQQHQQQPDLQQPCLQDELPSQLLQQSVVPDVQSQPLSPALQPLMPLEQLPPPPLSMYHDTVQCADACIAYLFQHARHQEAVMHSLAISADCPQPPVCPSPAAYKAALTSALLTFQQELTQLAQRYSMHSQQPLAWRHFLLLRSDFLQKHSTAPFVNTLCSQKLQTVTLLCWFHVKQAWIESCKPKVRSQDSWDDMYNKLHDIMHHPGQTCRSISEALLNATSTQNQLQSSTCRTIDFAMNGYSSGLRLLSCLTTAITTPTCQ